MPSNPTLPEDVRAELIRAIRHAGVQHGTGTGMVEMAVSAQPEVFLDAVAPLIIEWARKDQAEKDAQIAEFKIRNYRTIGSPGRADAARDIRAQFDTPNETTGGE